MLDGTNKSVVTREFEKLKNPVKVLVFTSLNENGYRDCPACEDTWNFVKEIADLSNEKVIVEEISIHTNKERAEEFGVDRAPVIILEGTGIKYLGTPLGQEAAVFLQTLIMASTGETGVSRPVKNMFKKLDKPKKIETVITLTCPYCPHSVLLGNRLTLASDGKLVHDIIEAYENPDLAVKYKAQGVPVTIIDGDPNNSIVGVPPTNLILEKIVGKPKVAETGMYS